MKLRRLLILLLVILFALLQCTLLNDIRIFRIKPDILLILVAFFALNFGPVYGLGAGALCGLFAEATSGIPAGTAVLAYAFGGLLLSHSAKGFYKRTLLSKVAITFIFTFAVYLLLFLLFRALNIRVPLFNALISIIIPASFYTACLSPLLFRFLRLFGA